jgi:hypothetical protein
VQEAPSAGAFDRAGDFRIEADLVQLNLSFLHVARELARSARELAITRLGLDAAACAALERVNTMNPAHNIRRASTNGAVRCNH